MLFLSQPDPPPTPQKSLRICENLMSAFFEKWVGLNPPKPTRDPATVDPPRIRKSPRKKIKKQYLHHNNFTPDMWFPPEAHNLELTLLGGLV